MKKRILFFAIFILVFVGLAILVAALTRPVIPSDSEGKIAVYSKNKPDLEMTVAIIDGETVTLKAYGRNGPLDEIPDREYEIGTITTTFTGAMVAKAVVEERIRLRDKVSDHMVLSPGTYAPTIFELVTHTSAYGDYPGYSKMKYKAGKNPFYGINYPEIITTMDDFRLNQTPPYLYSYSDLGATVIGMTLEDMYGTDYFDLLMSFLDELGLYETGVALDQSEAPKDGWVWKETDEYMAAYGLHTTVGDMIKYAKMFINRQNYVLTLACTPLVEVNMETNVGYFWGVGQTGILEKGGETSNYAAELLIDRQNGRAIIVLSNYSNDKYGNIPEIAKTIMNESFS